MNATETVKALTCDHGDCGSECPYYRWDGTYADVDAELEWCDEDAIKADAAALIEQQETELSALREAGRWIPVSERLPEEYTMVLVWDGDIVARAEWVLDYGWAGIPDDSGLYCDQITHWMPLPVAPEASEEGKQDGK